MTFQSIDNQEFIANAKPNYPVKFVGVFLMFCALSIAFLWLSIVIPTLLNKIYFLSKQTMISVSVLKIN
jgi:hypothetical protein